MSVVILSYDRPELLRSAIASVLAQSLPAAEILVIDNRSSRSPEIAELTAQHPEVRLIAQGNVGYSRGMNRGLREASTPYVTLMVDDVILDRDCLRELALFLEQNRDAGLASGLIQGRPSGRILCAGGEFPLDGRSELTLYGAGEIDRGQFQQPFDVSFLSGALLAGRRDLLRELGGFREYFFVYYDDAELCFRMRKRGLRVVVVPAARATHPDAGLTPSPSRVAFHSFKNAMTLHVLHASPAALWRMLVRQGLRPLLAGPQRATALRAWGWFLLHLPMLLHQRVSDRTRA